MTCLIQRVHKLLLPRFEFSLKIAQAGSVSVRHKGKTHFIEVPKPGEGKSYRRIVNFPEKYTVEPLTVRNLGGRDPVTGRKVCEGIGGGIKHKYHWVKFNRDGPEEGPPQEEKVIRVLKCGCRTANVALVAVKDEMKYILATENMKAGDIIRTSKYIPRNAVRPNEGDAYPVGALPAGTIVHNVQITPNKEFTSIHAAGCCGLVKNTIGSKVIVQYPNKHEVALDPRCMATVGRLSNVKHSSIPIGSANKLRELGYRSRSGLWHRKTGYHGRKIRPLPPVKHIMELPPPKEYIRFTSDKIPLKQKS
ncbi:hypothetical protein RUM43_006660 [Polyplax serrata]|uniref:Ribosomal protein L2 n=1 Tax=Polyplax serrata TaxID=468196 RepID=A0AAN8S938_POLSC